MKNILRVLIIEDSKEDALLLIHALRKGGFQPEAKRVASVNAVRQALTTELWDVILCDYHLPGFSAEEALHCWQEQGNDIPFILVSGAIGEETAVDLLKAGAHDFVKKENLSRLIPAIQRELREVEERKKRKQAEKELLLFKTVVETSGEAIAISDPDGMLLYINPAHAKLFGRSLEEARQCSYRDYYPLESIEVLNRVAAPVLARGESWEGELDVFDANGRRFPLWLRASSILDDKGNIVYAFGLMHDITERKQSEEKIERYKEHLEELVKERTAELEIAKDRALEAQSAAEAANRAKSEFLSNMSHELRTPMNAILGFAQLTERDPALTTSQREYLSIIRRSGEHLLRLINDVLDMSRIEAGRISLNSQGFDLWRVLLNIEEMMHVRAEDKSLEFIVTRAPDVPHYIKTDEAKLRQVLINLLSNAMKFTEEGEVKLKTENCRLNIEKSLKDCSSQSSIFNLQFSIHDTGIGIASEEIETIFKTFTRTTYSETTKEGTGLGLAISRKFVQLMGGDIHIESEVGKGSTFSFAIPVEVVDQSSIFQPVSGQASMHQSSIPKHVIGLEPNQRAVDGGPYRILVVEDHLENRLLLTRLLRSVGFEVREAINGQEAVEQYESWQPHLIWMDIRMPVMDGYEATKRIRALGTGHSVPGTDSPPPSPQNPIIIALTASAFEEDRRRVLAAGCDDFVRKPIQKTDIFEAMRKHLGVRYVYEEEKQVAGNKKQVAKKDELTPEMLAALPSELLAGLEDALLRGNMSKIDACVDEVCTYHQVVADVLMSLTKDFAYGEALRLIQQVKG